MCAACGQPGHRFGRNEGMERFDRQACIEGLLSKLKRAEAGLRDIAENDPHDAGWSIERCSEDRPDHYVTWCSACKARAALTEWEQE